MQPYNEEKYNRAKKKVKAIKGFHRHLTVYLVINIILLVIKLTIVSDYAEKLNHPNFDYWLNWNIIATPLLWGIGLVIHGLVVYRFSFGFIKRWEQKKMEEFMNED